MKLESKADRQYRKQFYRYTVGFGAALLIVYAMYFAVVENWFEGTSLAVYLLVLASIQFGLQMIVFLHATEEKRPRWTLWSIVYIFMMMLIIVVASLWIMHNMNYNMHMTPEQMREFMLEQNKKGF